MLKHEIHAQKQNAVEQFIATYTLGHGSQFPKLREIESSLEISKSNIHGMVKELEREGRISRKDGKFWLTDASYSLPERLNVK